MGWLFSWFNSSLFVSEAASTALLLPVYIFSAHFLSSYCSFSFRLHLNSAISFHSCPHLCIFLIYLVLWPSFQFISPVFLPPSPTTFFFHLSHLPITLLNFPSPPSFLFYLLNPTFLFFSSSHFFLLVYIPSIPSILSCLLLFFLYNSGSGRFAFSTTGSSSHTENKELQCHLLASLRTTHMVREEND